MTDSMEMQDSRKLLKAEYEALKEKRDRLYGEYMKAESEYLSKKTLADISELLAKSFYGKIVCDNSEAYYHILEIEGDKVRYLMVTRECMHSGMSSVSVKVATASMEAFSGIHYEPDTPIHFLEVYAEALREIPKLPAADEY